MDKPLTDKPKAVDSPAQDTETKVSPADAKAVSQQQTPAPQTASAEQDAQTAQDSGKPIGAYSEQSTRPLVTRKAWNEIDPHKPWSDDPKTRLAIRMFSRGVLGAAFFAAGGMVCRKWMNGYDPAKSLSAPGQQKNPLTYIAKLIDKTVGQGIENTVTAVAGKEMGMASVRFRPSRFGSRWGTGEMRGRSLGDETVNITFDFFCASIGDAWGRDIAGWFDPNVKKEWMDDHGHVNVPKALQSALKSVTRYVTYNGGEDWAVAIPYAYFMKAQRSLINSRSPGFKYDFDRGLNGGSFKLKDDKIVGNYQLEGLMDLQSRFTAYNVGTLMYREAYNFVESKISGRKDKLYGAPDKEENKKLLEKAGDLVKWAARSAVKGVIIMTPAVPFFWMTRTPQSQHKGVFIDPEKGMLGGLDVDKKPLYASSSHQDPNLQLSYMTHEYKPKSKRPGNFDAIHLSSGPTIAQFDPAFTKPHAYYANQSAFEPYARNFGGIDRVLNPLGDANYRFSQGMDGVAAYADKSFGSTGASVKELLGIKSDGFKGFTRSFGYATAAYTPYMYAKAEFANLWDNGKMDMAAERMIDGAFKFNWGEFTKGAGEVLSTVLQKPLADPVREAEGQRRMQLDTSAAASFSKTQAQMAQDRTRLQAEKAAKSSNTDKVKAKDLSWQERIVSAKPAAAPKAQDAEQSAQKTPAKNHAEQEALRKALEEHNPPTNSIN